MERQKQGYTGFINENIAVAPKPPGRLFGKHSIKITDTRLGCVVQIVLKVVVYNEESMENVVLKPNLKSEGLI